MAPDAEHSGINKAAVRQGASGTPGDLSPISTIPPVLGNIFLYGGDNTRRELEQMARSRIL